MEKSIINVKRLSCLLLMLIGLVGSLLAQERVTMLVGTYTGGGSKGVYSYRFNQSTGDAVILDSLEMSNPSFLTIAPNKMQYIHPYTHIIAKTIVVRLPYRIENPVKI